MTSTDEARKELGRALDSLEAEVVAMGAEARRALADAVEALVAEDAAACEAVVAGDDAIDRAHLEVEQHAIELLARQQPVAGDLRRVVACLHVALHLERVGDQAVRIAQAGARAAPLPADSALLQRVVVAAEAAVDMVEGALEALAAHDVERALEVAELDERVDAADRAIAGEVVQLSADASGREWAQLALDVSRRAERAADHAVDVCEQVVYLVTGELRELDRSR